MSTKRNNLFVGVLTVVLAVSAGMADLQESPVLTWPELQKEGKLAGGQIQPAGANGWQSLRIGNTGTTSMRCPIVTLDRIIPTSNKFAVEGLIKYQNVQGDAYLEMWTVLPDGRWFFTRTVAESSPLQRISGTSGWRSFSLPFNLSGASPKYVKLEIDVFMPGAGTIELGPLGIGGLSAGPAKASNVW